MTNHTSDVMTLRNLVLIINKSRGTVVEKISDPYFFVLLLMLVMITVTEQHGDLVAVSNKTSGTVAGKLIDSHYSILTVTPSYNYGNLLSFVAPFICNGSDRCM